MAISLKQLRYLTKVADVGSIQGAAEKLSISSSSIAAAISTAESAIGAPVFVRRPARGVTLTRAGERYIAAARALLAAHSEFERSAGALSSQPPQRIRIGCFEPFGALFMTAVLKNYRRVIGPIAIDLIEGDQESLHASLDAGMIDVAVTYDIGPSFASMTEITTVPTHALLSRDDPLARERRVSVAQLAERPMVLLDLPTTAAFLLAPFRVLARQPEIALRTKSYETVRSAVADGFGFAVLNMRPTTDFSADKDFVIRRPIIDRLPEPKLIVADAFGPQKPEFANAFIEATRSYFAGLPRSTYAVEPG